MSRIRISASTVLLWAIIALSIGYFLVEFRLTEADLRQTQQALAQSRADRTAIVEAHNALVADITVLVGDLDEAKADRNRLRDEVHELSEENRSLEHERSTLTQEYDHLEGAHEQLTATHEELGASHEALQVSHLELQTSHEALQVSQIELQTSHETLQTSHKALQGLHTNLNSQYRNLDRKHTELQQAVDTVEDLETQAGSLRTEIARLEERRRPLILSDERVRGFYCTGSMEPKLTCLDTATWLHDFKPEEVVVGATISFQSRACWSDEPSDDKTAHRVMEIKVIDGVHYYWPKGDANEMPDGCWIPESSVNGYIIEVHKNTRPANATLRNNVNAARAAYRTARDAYQDLRQFYGCYDFTVTCVVYSDFAYNELSRAYDIYEQAYDNYWNCWYRNAEDSEYPGHIPYTC